MGLHALAGWSLRWVVLAALWLGLTDTRKPVELAVGAVAAAIGATVASLVTRPGAPRTARNALDLLRLGPRSLLRPLLLLVRDTGRLTAVLWRHSVQRRPARGSFRVVRYRPGTTRDSAAGRALTEGWGSLPANRYVVGIDREHGFLVVHELVRSDEPLDPLGHR